MFVPVLHLHTYNNKQTLFYEFIMGNKHEVLGLKAKLGGLGEPPAARGNRGSGGRRPQFLAIL